MIETTDIIANEADYLIVSKKPGKLVQGDEGGNLSLLDEAAKIDGKSKLHLLTRLDRPVGGLVLFSKTKPFNTHYLAQQEGKMVSKEYLAIVEGKTEEKFVLNHYHRQDSKYKKARIVDKETKGYKAVTLECECIKKLERYSVLKLTLNSGKFHQIRAQLSFIGHPIKGDVKYGARRKNKDRSIYLHAHRISFTDLNKENREYVASPDKEDNLWKLVDEKNSN